MKNSKIKKISYTLFILLSLLVLSPSSGFSQNVPSAFIERDSVFFSKPYPYIMPILGSKAHEKGIKLPFPVGVMFNALTGTQSLTLSDVSLGFGRFSNPEGPELIDLSEVVTFEKVEAQTNTFNLRVDTWLLPFLNVYGIVGQTSKADINVRLIEPIPLEVTTEVSGTYLGFGAMVAGALGPVFFSLDANRTFSFNPRLDDPAKVTIAGFRTGPIFRFPKNPDMNVTLWAGAMYTNFNGDTSGRIRALDLGPNAPEKIDELRGDLDNWYNNLSPIEQTIFENLYNRLDNGLSGLKEGVEDGYLEYAFNKSIDNPWNMVIGAQWQINYRWQIRAEAQFLGDRTAGLFSLNYRFGVRGKNFLSRQ
jgi:hypothetical protein